MSQDRESGHEEALAMTTTVPNVGVLIGNPRTASRTTQIATEVAHQVAHEIDGVVETFIELGQHGADVLAPDAALVARDCDLITNLDVLVVASPTYKASYTGLLKSFLDRYPADGLAGVVAIPLMVGGVPHHALAVEVHLRPLLVELGATLPTPGLFILDHELEHLPATVHAWLGGCATPLRNAVGAATDKTTSPRGTACA